MTHASRTGLWLTATYRDADRMIAWLGAVGFTEHLLVKDGSSRVAHAEFLWPAGGGLMFGSYRENAEWGQRPGTSAAYLVTPDPDLLVTRAVEAGGELVTPVTDQDFGGRLGTVRDPEGNLWSVGSYQPA